MFQLLCYPACLWPTAVAVLLVPVASGKGRLRSTNVGTDIGMRGCPVPHGVRHPSVKCSKLVAHLAKRRGAHVGAVGRRASRGSGTKELFVHVVSGTYLLGSGVV